MENTKELYACAYKEVITILSLLPDEDWIKIPKQKRDFYFNNMNKNHQFMFEIEKPIYEQNLLTPTKVILGNIFKKYLASEEQKKDIFNRERLEYQVSENEKRKLYNPDNIFNNNSNSSHKSENNNYSKAYKEVMEILKYLPQESVQKIPKIMIKTFETKMDRNYKFKVDTNKSFEEQELLDETKNIIAIIFRDYFATTYQKEQIQAKERYDMNEIEKKKQQENQYNSNDIFNKNTKTSYIETNINNLPVEVKEEKFYHKIIKFIKKIFHKNKEGVT